MKIIKEYIKNKLPNFFALLRSFYCKMLHIKQLHTNVRYTLSSGYSFVIVSGTKWAFDPFAYNDLSNTYVREIKEMKSFLKSAQDRNTLLDIGALFGVFSLAFTCNSSLKSAFAIEPGPFQFSLLKKHARINKGNIKPFKLAFGDSEGFIQMRHDGMHLNALGENENSSEHLQIKVTTLDHFVIQNKISPDIIKIDVEGYEFHVLKGGEKFLKYSNPIIFCEIHAPWLERHGIKINHLEQLMRSLGYTIYDIDYNLINDLARYPSNKLISCNVIFRKEVEAGKS